MKEKTVGHMTKRSFSFIGCSELREMLGKQADDEKKLVELLEEVPLDSVYYHTHSFFLRHRYLVGSFPNDFAHWAATQVRDLVLGERLAVVDPFEFDSMEALREELISIIDDHLSRLSIVPRVVSGKPFFFNQSRIIEVPTGLEARTLPEFRTAIAEVEASAIYYHMFEASIRLARQESDFSFWVETSLGRPDLSAHIRSINPYLGSLERLRARLLDHCDECVAMPETA